MAKDVKVAILECGHRQIIGRDLFTKLGLYVIQSKLVLNVNQNQCTFRQQLALDLPALINRNGSSRKHTVRPTFHKDFAPTQQKGGRVPIHLQPSVKTGAQKLLDKKHIRKLKSCSDQ